MRRSIVGLFFAFLLTIIVFASAENEEKQIFAYYANGIAQFVYEEGGFVGLVNRKGEVILDAEYRSISPKYSDGLAAAQTGHSTVYIDENGKVVIDLMDVRGEAFKNGYTWITGENGKLLGFLSSNKDIKLLTASVDILYGEDVSDGLAFCVKKGQQLTGCYVNTDGEVAFERPLDPENPYEYEDYGVGDRLYDRSFHNGFALSEYAGRMFLIDKQGNVVRELPALYDFMNFSFGPLSVARDPKTRLCGYMNMMGEFVVPPLAKSPFSIYPMLEGRGLIEVDIEMGLWQCYDEKGQLLFEIQCDTISPFYQGYAVVTNGEAADVIDKDGNVILHNNTKIAKPKKHGSNYMPMSDGVIMFNEDNKYGFMNIQGKTVIEPQFDEIDMRSPIGSSDFLVVPFLGGYAYVKKEGLWYFINTEGEMITPGSLSNLFE